MQEIIVQSVGFEARRKRPSPEDGKLVDALIKKDATIESVIPDDISDEEFHRTLRAVSNTIVRAQMVSEGLMPVLGRLIAVARARPELWQTKHDTWEAFVGWIQATYGVCRATVFEVQRLATRWSGTVTTEQFEAVGRVKMGILSKVVGKGDEGKAATVKLIELASKSTAAEFIEALAKKGLIEASESTGSTGVKFPCNKRQFRDFNKWFNDARVQAFVGSGSWAEILDAMIAEVTTEWIEKGEAKLAAESTEAASVGADGAE